MGYDFDLVPASLVDGLAPATMTERASDLRHARASARTLAAARSERVFIFATGLPRLFPIDIVAADG